MGFQDFGFLNTPLKQRKRLCQFVVRLVERFLQAVEKVRNASRAQDERRSVNDYQSRSVRAEPSRTRD
jgi:hypothetical protein